MEDEKGLRIELKHAIPDKREGASNGAVVTALQFPPYLKVKHLKSMPDSLFEGGGQNVKPKELAPFIGALTELPEEMIDEIHLTDDLPRIAEGLNRFFGPMTTVEEVGE